MPTLADFRLDMRLSGLATRTIDARIETVERLAGWLNPGPLLDATPDTLTQYQRAFANLAPASVDIYTRHIQAFYRWALMRRLITVDPAADLPRPKIRRGTPHPTPLDDARAIFACTSGALRIAYLLAAFAGLRCGEVCTIERRDLELAAPATVRVQGKGGKERTVPLVPPVVHELHEHGLPRTGYLITRHGLPYDARVLSCDSHNHLRSIGVATTMHSLRHLFATRTYRDTRDLLMLAQLLGHSSVATTQIYAAPDMAAAHEKLAGVSMLASDMLGPQRLRSVG